MNHISKYHLIIITNNRYQFLKKKKKKLDQVELAKMNHNLFKCNKLLV